MNERHNYWYHGIPWHFQWNKVFVMILYMLGGMIINKEGDFGPCILWKVEIHGRGLVKKEYDTFCTLCLK